MGYGVTGLAANLPGTITPYPVLDFTLGLGGFRSAASSAARNAILPQFRLRGMVVVQDSDDFAYQEVGGAADGNWKSFAYQQIQDGTAGTPMARESIFQVTGGYLTDLPGSNTTDLSLMYQFVSRSGEVMAPEQHLDFGLADFVLTDDAAAGATRVALARSLPAVTTADNGDSLVVAAGVWAAGLNGARSVSTIAQRNALLTAGIVSAGIFCYVTTTQCLYMLDNSLTTWTIVASSAALSNQAVWEVNQSTGSDSNDGLTVGTALQTLTELSSRLSPGGASRQFNQTTNINIAAGTYNETLALNITFRPTIAQFTDYLQINGSVTALTDTLTAINASVPATQTPGQVTTASGIFSNKCRIRSTSGANVDAIAWSTGLNAGASNSYISQWINWQTGATTVPANGTTVAVETITVNVKNIDVSVGGRGYLTFHNLNITGGAYIEGRSYLSQSLFFWACSFAASAQVVTDEDCYFYSCSNNAGVGFSSGDYRFYGHAFQGSAKVWWGGSLTTKFSCVIDGGQLISGGDFKPCTIILSGSAIELVRGGGAPAISLLSNTRGVDGVGAWGRTVSTSNYSVFVAMQADCVWDSAVTVSGFILPITNGFSISTKLFPLSAAPVFMPLQAAGFVLESNVNSAQCDAVYVGPAAFATNVGPLGIMTVNTPGWYRIEASIIATTLATSAAACALNVIYTDAVGAVTKAVFAIDLGAANRGSGVWNFRSTGGTLQYSITGIVTPGPLAASYDIVLTRLNN